MNTQIHPYLPSPPLLPRMRCCNYNVSSYCWYLNKALRFTFSNMYLDMEYGAFLFNVDRTVDYEEIQYDATDITINIAGTEYDRTWTPVTTTVGERKISWISRTGFDPAGDPRTFEDAWDDYVNDPQWFAADDRIYGYAEMRYYNKYPGPDGPHKYIVGKKLFLEFDTRTIDDTFVSAVLRIYVLDWYESVTGDNIQVNTYVHDFGSTVTAADWTGGVLADNTTIINESDAESWMEIPLEADEVNAGGYSRYRISIKEIDDNVFLGEATFRKAFIINDAELKLTY